MKKILATLNRLLFQLLLLCSLLSLLCGIATIIIDAARSIGGSAIVLTSLQNMLADFGVGNVLGAGKPAEGFMGMVADYFLALPAAALFMALALVFYLMSYIFKRS